MRKLSLAAVLAGLTVLACYQDDTTPQGPGGKALTRVLLTDAPFPFDQVRNVLIHVVRVQASTSADTSGGAIWTTIAEPRRVFDLLQLQQGTTTLLGEGELPAGQYRSIRVTINTDLSRIVNNDGSLAQVNWQRSGEQDLYALVEAPLEVSPQGAQIVIDFDVGRSFIYHGGNQYTFLYVLRAVNSAVTGAIAGTVRSDGGSAVVNAAIGVLKGDPAWSSATWSVAATGHTDSQGRYRVAFLRAGTYHVRVEPPTPGLAPVTTTNITVTAGSETQHSVTLQRRTGAYVEIIGNSIMPVGAVDTIAAVVGDQNGNPIPSPYVSWWSSDPVVASVEPTGVRVGVQAHRVGFTTIVASSSGASDSLTIQVRSATDSSSTAAVATVTLSPPGDTLVVGDSAGFYATLRDAGGNVLVNRPITWTTSNSSVVQITGAFGASVLVRAAGAGTATITATSEGKNGAAEVKVNP